MSRSESQGLQIALILSVMLIVALGVTTYIFFKKANEKTGEAQTARNNLDTARRDRDAYQAGFYILKSMVGHGELPQAQIDADYRPNLSGNDEVLTAMGEIETRYKTDMQQFGADFTEVKSYHSLPEYLVDVIEKKDQALKTANEGLRASKSTVAQVQAEEQKKTKAAEDALAVALARVAELDAANRVETQRMLTEATTRSDLLAQATQRYKVLQEESAAVLAAEKRQVSELRQINDVLVGKIRSEETAGVVNSEQPDGSITWVNQRTQVVWINLGIADGLRRAQTFSVVDREETNLGAAPPKAQIEVTRLIDKHLAEAKILSDAIDDPILPGDVFFSPAWSPGAKIHFALVGFLDYNEDGNSDHQLVRNIITSNNGVIDAEITPDGERVGNITTDTRYLVVGDRPNERSAPEALTLYSDMLNEATRYGVEQISVKKLLSSMGFRGETRTVGLGRGATEGDFSPTAKDGVAPTSNGNTSGIFRNRRPPGAKGAF